MPSSTRSTPPLAGFGEACPQDSFGGVYPAVFLAGGLRRRGWISSLRLRSGWARQKVKSRCTGCRKAAHGGQASRQKVKRGGQATTISSPAFRRDGAKGAHIGWGRRWGRRNENCTPKRNGQTFSVCPMSVKDHFSLRTPLKGLSSAFWSMNCPVSASRLIHLSTLGLKTSERSRTAPFRWSSPGGGLVAIVTAPPLRPVLRLG